MKNRRTAHRSFPGRLTLEEWLELPFLARLDLAHRAQCELLLGLRHRLCARKQCQRHRTCCGESPIGCAQQLWQRTPKARQSKALGHEHWRLADLASLRGPDGIAPWDAKFLEKKSQKPRTVLAHSGRTARGSGAGRSTRVRAGKESSAAGLWEIIQTGRSGEGDKLP